MPLLIVYSQKFYSVFLHFPIERFDVALLSRMMRPR